MTVVVAPSPSVDWRSYVNRKPETREQLVTWLSVFVKLPILTQNRCPHHNSMLDYIAGAFFNEYGSCVVKAARHAGKSYSAAIACFLDGHFKPGINVVVMGKTQMQSNKIYSELLGVLQAFERTTGMKIASWADGGGGGGKTTDVQFRNGSVISFLTGSGRVGIRSQHPSVIILDEADEFTDEYFQSLENAINVTERYPTRVDLLSTNYSLEGDGLICAKEKEFDEWQKTRTATDREKRVYRVCLVDLLQNCGDEWQCDSCPLAPYCKGAAKAQQTDGFYSIKIAREKFGGIDKRTMESELMLLRPTAKHAYFPDFSLTENVKDVPFDASLKHTYINFDFGQGRLPCAATVVQIDTSLTYRVTDEFRSFTGERLGSFLARIKTKYPQAPSWGCFYDPAGNKKDSVHGDSERDELIRQGFVHAYCTTTVKRAPSFQLLSTLILAADGSRKLVIDKKCENLIRQVQAAKHKVDGDRVSKEPYDPKDDHELDTLRYCVAITQNILAVKRMPKLRW